MSQGPINVLSTQGGTNGFDYSANPPLFPQVGAGAWPTVAGSPYNGFVLLAVVPASRPTTRRNAVIAQNTSGFGVIMLRDDGTAAAGQYPVNATLFALNPGPNVGAGGDWYVSLTFKGRLSFYGPSGAQVAVAVD